MIQEDRAVTQEMLEEQLVRLLTREVLDLLSKSSQQLVSLVFYIKTCQQYHVTIVNHLFN